MKFLFDVESYRTRFKGGARQYLFFVLLRFPGNQFAPVESSGELGKLTDSIAATFGAGASKDFYPYLVKSTILPDSNIEEKIIPMQHFSWKLPGDRVYNDWTVTFNIDDKGLLLRNLHSWQDVIHSVGSRDERLNAGTGGDFETSILNYTSGTIRNVQTVFLVDYIGNVSSYYDLYGAWPKNIGQVQFDYMANELATVDVTFSYLYHRCGVVKSSELSSIIKKGANVLLGSVL